MNVFSDCFKDPTNAWVCSTQVNYYLIEFNISFLFAGRSKQVFKKPAKCSVSFTIIPLNNCVPALKLFDSCQDLIWRSCEVQSHFIKPYCPLQHDFFHLLHQSRLFRISWVASINKLTPKLQQFNTTNVYFSSMLCPHGWGEGQALLHRVNQGSRRTEVHNLNTTQEKSQRVMSCHIFNASAQKWTASCTHS